MSRVTHGGQSGRADEMRTKPATEAPHLAPYTPRGSSVGFVLAPGCAGLGAPAGSSCAPGAGQLVPWQARSGCRSWELPLLSFQSKSMAHPLGDISTRVLSLVNVVIRLEYFFKR